MTFYILSPLEGVITSWQTSWTNLMNRRQSRPQTKRQRSIDSEEQKRLPTHLSVALNGPVLDASLPVSLRRDRTVLLGEERIEEEMK